jgi:hypothetical protein
VRLLGCRGPSEGDDQPDGHSDHDSADDPAGQRHDYPGHTDHDPGLALGHRDLRIALGHCDEPIRYPDADRHPEPGSGPQPHPQLDDHLASGL